MVSLSENELEKYSRQIKISGVGNEGQEKLKQARVTVVGVGGLGSIVTQYLAVAGIGTLHIIDRDRVERSNLNRQILFCEDNIGQLKSELACAKLRQLNPDIEVRYECVSVDDDTVDRLLEGTDAVVDCLDNFAARYAINRCCVSKGIPFIHGGVAGFHGQLFTVIPGDTPCLSCVVPDAETEAKPGIFGAVAGVIGTLQAVETIKLLTGLGDLYTNRMLVWDGRRGAFGELATSKDPACGVCGLKQ